PFPRALPATSGARPCCETGYLSGKCSFRDLIEGGERFHSALAGVGYEAGRVSVTECDQHHDSFVACQIEQLAHSPVVGRDVRPVYAAGTQPQRFQREQEGHRSKRAIDVYDVPVLLVEKCAQPTHDDCNCRKIVVEALRSRGELRHPPDHAGLIEDPELEWLAVAGAR